MPDENVFTFTVAGSDGKETQVTVPQDAVFSAIEGKGFIREDKIAKDLDRRVKSVIEKKGLKDPSELLKDPEFLAQAREGYVQATGDDASGKKQLVDALKQQEQDLQTRRVKPLEEKLTAAQEREEGLLARDLDRQLQIAVRDAGVKPALRNAAVASLRAKMGLNEEDGEFYVVDAKGDGVLSKSGGSNTYQTVNEGVSEWANDPANADWLDSQSQSGPGVGGGRGRRDGAEPGNIVLTEEQASDAQTWNKALAQVGGDASKIRIKKDPSRTAFLG